MAYCKRKEKIWEKKETPDPRNVIHTLKGLQYEFVQNLLRALQEDIFILNDCTKRMANKGWNFAVTNAVLNARMINLTKIAKYERAGRT